MLAAPVSLELLRQTLGLRFGAERLFHFAPTTLPLWLLVMLATVLSVAIPIKIWNTARIEHRLQEQEQLLMAAKVDALASQINPHFFVQHVDVDLVPDQVAAGNGSDADC